MDAGTRRMTGTSSSGSGTSRDHQRRSSQVLMSEAHSSVPDLNVELGEVESSRKAKTPQQENQRERYSRNQGGSLKFSRLRDETNSVHESFRRGRNFLDIGTSSWARERLEQQNKAAISLESECSNSGDLSFEQTGSFSRSTRNGLVAASEQKSREPVITRSFDVVDHQTNPSDNVILEPLTSVNLNDPKRRPNVGPAINDEDAAAGASIAAAASSSSSSACWRTRRQDEDEKRRRRVPSPGARLTNNDHHNLVQTPINNHESKHNKLDRSKSLD